jgi:hypothetical protein
MISVKICVTICEKSLRDTEKLVIDLTSTAENS